jgi:DNA-binding MarR family transcriptional regulator
METPRPIRRLSDDDFRLLAQWRYALRRFLQFSERAAAQLGVTAQQYQCLLAIRGFPGRSRVTVGELAERMCIQHHSAVGLVDRLVERELVRRVASRGDRRHVFVELTAHGERVLEELATVHRAEMRRLRPELFAVISTIEE